MAKRNAAGSGSLRKRVRTIQGVEYVYWEGSVSVGHDPATGKLIRKTISGKTQKEVRQKMQDIISDVNHRKYQDPSKTTVAEWMAEWLETYCKNKVKPLTFQSYEAIIKNHIANTIGAVRLQDVTGADVQRVYNVMIENGKSGKTCKNVGAIMHKAFSMACKQHKISFNPVDAAELPSSTKREITPLLDNEIPVFLKAIDDSPFRNAYALCLFAGLREGECLGLDWDDVDFQKGTITVRQQLQKEKKKDGKYYIMDTTKSGKPRTIKPPPLCFDYLRDEQTKQLSNRLRAGKAWDNPDNLVFTDALGKHLIPMTFYRHFKKIVTEIGRPDARPHDLRHTAATIALSMGADIKSVQDLLGHATASFTLDVYAHSTDRMRQDTANRVQNYYDNLLIAK